MIAILYLSLTLVVGYLIGNINFARIFSWIFAKKDITTVGSKNPGTMNMLRTRGFGEALLTLIFEAIKSGVPAIASYFIFRHYFPNDGWENLAYLLTAIGAIIGHCFPVFYKFKGGKGVACTFGLFLFNPNTWWISIIMFVICFVLFFFIDYPFIISLTFILVLSIYSTAYFAIYSVTWFIPLIILIWLNFLLILFMHRGNIKRLISGTENKVHFADKVFKKHKKDETENQEISKQTAEATIEASEENIKEKEDK